MSYQLFISEPPARPALSQLTDARGAKNKRKGARRRGRGRGRRDYRRVCSGPWVRWGRPTWPSPRRPRLPACSTPCRCLPALRANGKSSVSLTWKGHAGQLLKHAHREARSPRRCRPSRPPPPPASSQHHQLS
eukprot:1060639-Rhodomonas_salina.1